MPRTPAGRLCGESHPKSKLTDLAVLEIRRRREVCGALYVELAVEFGVSRWCIAKICRYERRIAHLTQSKP